MHQWAMRRLILLQQVLRPHCAEAYEIGVPRPPSRGGERRWIQPLEDLRGIQPRCAKDLKRHPGAAADGDVRTLEKAEAGIMKGALEIGHVWRRFDPGETRLVV